MAALSYPHGRTDAFFVLGGGTHVEVKETLLRSALCR